MTPVFVYGYGRRKHILDPDGSKQQQRAQKALCGSHGYSSDGPAPGWTQEQVEAAWPTCAHCERAWAKRAQS